MSVGFSRGLCLLTWCALMAGLGGCETPTIPEMPPVQVTATQAYVTTITAQKVFVGNIEAVDEVTLRARVTGTLEKVEFKAGQYVQQGQELFQIEQDLYLARQEQAKAQLDKTTVEMTLAKENYDRAINARRGGGISEEELAESRAQFEQSQAVQQDALQSLRLAELDVGYTTVKAPFDGQISRRLIDAGNLVSGAEGTKLATVITTDPVHVYFAVPENLVNLLRRKVGTTEIKQDRVKIAVRLDGETNFDHQGWVDYIDIAIDKQTGTARVRGVVPNPRNFLQPGQFASIMVFGDPIEDALLVNEEAISSDLRGQYLLTVNEDGLVQKKPVELRGLYMNDQMRHVTPLPATLELEAVPPFSADDWYIVRGLAKAFPGMEVEVTRDAELGRPAESATPRAVDPPGTTSPPTAGTADET